MEATPAPGPKKRLSHDARRRLIIETTLLCLARDGAEGTTLRSVSRELDVAPSLITHFFENWHDLLAAAYDALVTRALGQLSLAIGASYPTARARMDAVMKVYLSTDWAGESSIGASIAFWQLSRSVVGLRPLFSRYLVERRKLLRRALRDLAAEAGARVDIGRLTDGFMLMLDGIWLEISLNPGSIAERRTREMCWFWLDGLIGGAPRSGRTRRAEAAPLRKRISPGWSE